MLGLDVDAYGDKTGLDTLLGKVDDLGPLPPTHISTSRNDGVSGIRFYRVPAGRRWADILGPGVEIIHYGHRYAVAAPSIHPEGRTYRWIGPDGQPCDAPAVDDLPDLPDTWVASLDGGDVADRPGKADVDNDEVRAWLDQLPQGEPCAYLTRLLEAAETDLGDPQTRHDKARTAVARIVRGGDQGHTGASTALDTLQSVWLAALKSGSARRPDPGEWSRMVAGAVAMCAKQPTLDADKGCCGDGSDTAWIPDHVPDTLQRKVAKRVKVQLKPGTSTAEIGRAILEGRQVDIGEHVASVDVEWGRNVTPRPSVAEDEFWTSRPELQAIHWWARARMAAPWAVLGAVIARTAAAVPPWVTLPAIIGTEASLNTFVAYVGKSGEGKGAADGAAAACLDLTGTEPFVTVGAGSGEGLAHLYMRRLRNHDVEQHNKSVLLSVAEIDTLVGLKGRQGSTLLPELRKAWSGEQLGFAYADATKRLTVPAHAYRLSLLAGVQPARAAVLLDDDAGGTPQRFLWFSTLDPNMPDSPPEAPAQVEVKLHRDWNRQTSHTTPMHVCDIAVQTIQRARLDRNRGIADALDGHALLCRLKVAAVLGLLAGRTDVSPEDWRLSGVVARHSDRTRAKVQAELEKRRQAQIDARAHDEGRGEIVRTAMVDGANVQRACKSIVRKLQNEGGWVSGAALRKTVTSRARVHFEEAVEKLLDTGQIEAEDVEYRSQSGRRFRVAGGSV